MNRYITLLLLIFSATGCLNRPERRVELDKRVGHAQFDGLGTVTVEKGSAQVRRFEPGVLELMGQAPLFTGTLVLDEPLERLVVTLHNSMPDATLSLLTPTGDASEVGLMDTQYPTHRRWELRDLPAGITTFRVEGGRSLTAEPFRFAYLSDVQEGIGGVQDIYKVMNLDPDIAFVVGGGDTTHRGRPAQIERFLEELTQLRVPMFTTSGNHDVGWGEERTWFAYMGRNSFHFVFRGVHFTFLDSADATLDPSVYSWLDGWLAEGRDAVHVVTTHIAPIDPVGSRNGSFSSRREAQLLLSKLASGGVDLTLYVHIHSYYAFENAGIPAYISGGGGGPEERLDGIGRHYLTVDVDPAVGITKVSVVRID